MKRLAAALLTLALLGAAPAPPAKGHTTTISIDMRGADIYDVVQVLAMQSRVNIVLHTSVKHDRITLRVVDRPFSDVVRALCEQNDLVAVESGGSLVLGRSEIMVRRGSASGDKLGIFTERFSLRNSRPLEVVSSLKSALPVNTVVVPDTRGNAVVVTGSDAVVAHARRLVEELDVPINRGDSFSSKTISLAYVDPKLAAETIRNALAPQAPNAIFASPQANGVIVSGTSDFISSVATMVSALDKAGRQVIFEVRVADVTDLDDHSDIGAVFRGRTQSGGTAAGQISFALPSGGVGASMEAQLNFLVSKGSARILATPRIATLNGTRAELNIGTAYPVVFYDARTGNPQFQTVRAGVNLAFTPSISPDSTTTVELQCSYSEIVGFQSNYPIIGSREARDTLRVRDGETIVLAGLFREIDAETVTKVPVLGDIPFVGSIFRDRKKDHTRDEIVFLITPHLVPETSDTK